MGILQIGTNSIKISEDSLDNNFELFLDGHLTDLVELSYLEADTDYELSYREKINETNDDDGDLRLTDLKYYKFRTAPKPAIFNITKIYEDSVEISVELSSEVLVISTANDKVVIHLSKTSERVIKGISQGRDFFDFFTGSYEK